MLLHGGTCIQPDASIGVKPDGTIEHLKQHDADTNNGQRTVEVGADGSPHVVEASSEVEVQEHKQASGAAVETHEEGQTPSLLVREEAGAASTEDVAHHVADNSSQMPVLPAPTAQVIMGVLIPQVETALKKYSTLNKGKCPSTLPVVPGFVVDSPYDYGAGCRGGNICLCPGGWQEECATGARLTGGKLGSGVTAVSVEVLGYCRRSTKIYVAGAGALFGVFLAVGLKTGWVKSPLGLGGAMGQ